LVTVGLYESLPTTRQCFANENWKVFLKTMDYFPLEYVIELCCMIAMRSFLCDETMMSRYTRPLSSACS